MKVLQKNKQTLFIFAGNAPYTNRGCEAIVRGTVSILSRSFPESRFLLCSHYLNKNDFISQRANEIDDRIEHAPMNLLFNAKNKWINKFLWKLYKFFPYFRLRYIYSQIDKKIDSSLAVLAVGGDNYSLDYGKPQYFTDLDDLVAQKGGILAIWGASIGPFSRLPKYEKYMKQHLKKVDCIFARETKSIEYLDHLGVKDNVFKIADPAFAMDPKEPKDSSRFKGLEKHLGINLSPLMAKYITNGDQALWLKKAVSILKGIKEKYPMPIILIPHVFDKGNNDLEFMGKIREAGHFTDIDLIDDAYSAAEIKWIISRLRFFLGARTHATIAAISTGVPTISLAYSMKAVGLNKDIFGSLDYCLSPELLNEQNTIKALGSLITNEKKLREHLSVKKAALRNEALKAGEYLKELIDKHKA